MAEEPAKQAVPQDVVTRLQAMYDKPAVSDLPYLLQQQLNEHGSVNVQQVISKIQEQGWTWDPNQPITEFVEDSGVH